MLRFGPPASARAKSNARPKAGAGNRRLPLIERLREDHAQLSDKRDKLASVVYRLESEHEGLQNEIQENPLAHTMKKHTE